MNKYKEEYKNILKTPFVRQRVPMFVGEFASLCRKFNKELLQDNIINQQEYKEIEDLVRKVNKYMLRTDLNTLLDNYKFLIAQLD